MEKGAPFLLRRNDGICKVGLERIAGEWSLQTPKRSERHELEGSRWADKGQGFSNCFEHIRAAMLEEKKETMKLGF